MRCTVNCKLGESLERRVSSVLQASVSGVVLPRTTHVSFAHVFGQRVLSHPFPAVTKPNPYICHAAALYLR